ncbi:MAG TPA: hypothetical protein VGG90_06735, partial [Candidatus Dormibacteraeota bacterium]
MGRRDVQAQLLHEAGQAWCLALGQVKHHAGKRGGVDDGVREGAFQPAPDQPSVEGVVAVLDQHGPLRKTQETAARVTELRRTDQHRAIDVVPFLGVRVDRRATVDERVEEGQRPIEAEP